MRGVSGSFRGARYGAISRQANFSLVLSFHYWFVAGRQVSKKHLAILFRA